MWARVISGIIGAFMLLQAFTWLIDPSSAAAGLSMSLLEGQGGNTQIGDFTAFFFTAGLWQSLELIGASTFGYIQQYLYWALLLYLEFLLVYFMARNFYPQL